MAYTGRTFTFTFKLLHGISTISNVLRNSRSFVAHCVEKEIKNMALKSVILKEDKIPVMVLQTKTLR
jgi:hypothetical protein